MTKSEIEELTRYAKQRRAWRFDRARRVQELLPKLLADHLYQRARIADLTMRLDRLGAQL